MKRKGIVTLAVATLSVATLGAAMAAQVKDKYALKVPGGTRVLGVQGLRELADRRRQSE
jgi:hypothetical protein